MRIRKEMLELFQKLEQTAQKLLLIPPEYLGGRSKNNRKSAGEIIARNLHISIVHYLQLRMFTLRLFPNPKPISAASSPIKIKSEFAVLLEQQIANIEQQIREATACRRFEDVRALQRSLNELIEELNLNA